MTARLAVLGLGLGCLVASWLVTCHLWRYREVAAGIAWLPDREFAGLTVVTVGTGAAHENPRHLGPATAVAGGTRLVLVDAGRGVAEALRASEIPVSQPDTVLLTSLLPENTLGLDDLLLTGWLAPRARPLRLVGPPGTRAFAEALLAAHATGVGALAEEVGLPLTGAELAVEEAEAGWSESRDGLEVRAAAVGAGPLPGLAFRFEAGGRSVVVAGVGPDPDSLAELARGADALVVEGFHAESVELAIEAGAEEPERLRREASLHLPLGEAARVASRAGVRTLLLTRLRPPPLFDRQFTEPIAGSFGGRIRVARDGAELTP